MKIFFKGGAPRYPSAMETRRAIAQFVRDRPVLWDLFHPTYDRFRQFFRDARIRRLGDRLAPSDAAGHALLAEAILRGGPLGVGKIGGLEAEAAGFFLSGRPRGKPYPERLRRQMFLNVGLFPVDDGSLDRFCAALIEAAGQLDILGLMGFSGESEVLSQHAKTARLISLRALDPWNFPDPWSRHLQGRRVTVLSPFAATIGRQFQRRSEIWPGRDVLPDFQLRTVTMPLSPGLKRPAEASWEARLDAVKAAIDAEPYDVVLAGAGGISILIAAHVRRAGGIGFHMGGPTQVLFGVRGRRWENEPVLTQAVNAAWVRPSGEEAPPAASQIERGAYW